MFFPCLGSYFLELKKLKTVNKTLKIEIFRQFFHKAEGEEWDQKDWNASD